MIALLVAAAAACSGDCRAQSLFESMERKLLAGVTQLEVTSHAEGAVQADAVSTVSVGPATRVHSKGTFLGKPFAPDFDEQTTPALREALLLGMSRMGLMHNVANLSQGNGIDHAQGGVRDWLQAVKFRRVKGGVRYTIHLQGSDRGETTLYIDSKTKLPQRRTAVVHFGNADMRVIETYRFPLKQ